MISIKTLSSLRKASSLKGKEYVCLLIKSLEDCFKKLTIEDASHILLNGKDQIMEVLCTGAE